jgi:acid phosphatase type 7
MKLRASVILAARSLVVLAVITACDERALTVTAPTAPSLTPSAGALTASGPADAYTFVGASNIASCSWDGDELTAQVLDGIVAQDPNATVFNAGDAAYDGTSTASELANCYGPNWGRHKARTYVALGNNEYKTDPNPTWDYFGDRAGPRGKGYYSYDLGAWHVVMLNDNIAFGPGSAQDTWLQQDLAASASTCTIAVFHRPLFSSGAASSTPSRKPIWDRLYAAGVEIVLNGHRTWYERFAPQTPDGTVDAANGIREFVVGTGGFTTGIDTPTAANVEKQGNTRGVLKLTLTPGGYTWQYVPIAGKTFTDTGSGTCH